jgi:uracil-DNA glycosylase
MTKLVICGQAPSRIGDGRPFSGPSGKRLAALFGLEDYEELASRVTLTNIFDVIACRPKNARHAGDEFDKTTARAIGMMRVHLWARDPEHVVVLGCGANVMEALVGKAPGMYKGKALKVEPARGLDIWHFPHPSGASHYWNDPANVDRASRFLRRFLKHYEISITK